MLRVLCQLFIFIEHLRRISARTIINSVGLITTCWTAIGIWTTAATAIAVIVTIVIQGILFPVATIGGVKYAGLVK
ncbi:hypothetical protein GCM10023115_02040 [Pontixanthobacter gangjinensis]